MSDKKPYVKPSLIQYDEPPKDFVPDLRIVGDVNLGTLRFSGDRITFTKPDGTVILDETSDEGWSLYMPPDAPIGDGSVMFKMTKGDATNE